jgi:hypothetical protein
MKKIFLVLAFFALPLISAETPVKTEAEKTDTVKIQEDTAKTLESYSWDNKKFSIGIEALNGIGIYNFGVYNRSFLLPSAVSLLQLNMRVWLWPNVQISLHSSINYDWNSVEVVMPILINIGYGMSIRNMYWFIEGGGGVANILFTSLPVIDMTLGVEWLQSKSYAVGFNIKFGYLIEPYFFSPNENIPFLNLSITANLVL